MIYRILSIAAKILFSVAGLVGVACLVWTLATSAVQEGFDTASAAIDKMVNDAMTAMEVDWGIDVSGVLGGSSEESGRSVENATSGAADAGRSSSSGGFDLLGSLTGLLSGLGSSGSAELTVDDFVNAAQGQAYLTWKAAIDDPLGRIFEGTGITTALLEGAAGGSGSASSVLTNLDETALTVASANASSYAATAAANSVPASLPEGVRSLMWEANSAAQGFAASVQSVVTAIRSVKAGNAAALVDLGTAAGKLAEDVQTLELCMSQAEALLVK